MMNKYQMTLDMLKAAEDVLLLRENVEQVFDLRDEQDQEVYFKISHLWLEIYELYKAERGNENE